MLSTGSGAHDAALIASTRTMDYQVLVDWPHGGTDGDYGSPIQDVTAAVVSLELDRALTTTLPAEVRLSEGVAVAELTITLGGQDTPALVGSDGVSCNIISLFNPYNTASEFYRDNLLGRDVKVYAGAYGFTLLQVFTGRIRKIEPSPAAGTVKITVLDYSERLRVPTELPVFAADAEAGPAGQVSKPGLNATWVVNYLARQAGFYTSPQRSLTLLAVSGRGSAYPEVGSLLNCEANHILALPELTSAARFIDGPNGRAMQLADGLDPRYGGYYLEAYYGFSPRPVNAGTVFFEGWFRGDAWDVSLTGDATGLVRQSVGSYYPVIDVNPDPDVPTTLNLSYWRDFDAGRDFHQITSAWPVASSTFHYLGVRIDFTSTTATLTVRVDGTTYSAVTLTPPAGAPTVDYIMTASLSSFGGTLDACSDFCVTRETGTIAWNNTFSQTSVEIGTSALDLSMIPPTVKTGSDVYSILQDIAQAEAGATGFDEDGTFYYRPRSYYESATGYTSVRTIDADSALIDLATATAIDSVRNDIRVPVQPYTVSLYQVLWQASEAIKLTGGQRLTINIPFTDPVFEVAVPVYGNVPWSMDPTGPAASGFYGNKLADGSNYKFSNVSVGLKGTADGIALTLTNQVRNVMYLVYPKGLMNGSTDVGGQPSLWLGGRVGKTGNPTKVQVMDETATLAQVYEAPTSVWRQTTSVATAMAVELLADLGTPRPQFVDVPIIGDPRLQLGDVVTVTDPYRLDISEEARIIGIRTTAGPGQFAQTLNVRALYSPGQLILNRTGQDELNAGWVLG